MHIRTIHSSVSVTIKDKPETFKFIACVDYPKMFEGNVPDEVGEFLLSIKRKPQEYVKIVDEEAPKKLKKAE